MMSRYWHPAVLLLPLCVFELSAQSNYTSQLENLAKRPFSTWTDHEAVQLTEAVLNFILDSLWESNEFVELRTEVKPGIQVSVQGRRRAPSAAKNTIRFSVEYFELVHELSMLLGHDTVTSSGVSIKQLPKQVRNGAFRVGRLIPSLDPLVLFLQNNLWFAMQRSIVCSPGDAECHYLQNAAFGAMLTFILAHEIGHLKLRHPERSGAEYPIDEELEADSLALRLMTRLLGGMSQYKRSVPTVFYGAPLLLLSFEQSVASGASADILQQRIENLLRGMPESDRRKARSVAIPKRESKPTGVVRIDSDVMPDKIFIDGVEVPPSAVLGKTFLLVKDVHHVFARKGPQYGYAEVFLRPAGVERVKLQWTVLGTKSESVHKIQSFLDEGEYWEAFQRTADANGLARHGEVEHLHAAALHGLYMDSLIKPPSRRLSDEQKSDINSWMNDAVPLRWSWRLD